jgi:hypothetical protein
MTQQMTDRKIGTREEWLTARATAHPRRSTAGRGRTRRFRQELPWVRVEGVQLRTDEGEKALGELSEGRSQLLVYHFMFGPSYQAGCPVNRRRRRRRRRAPHQLPETCRSSRLQAPLEKLQAFAPYGLSFPGSRPTHRLQLRPWPHTGVRSPGCRE